MLLRKTGIHFCESMLSQNRMLIGLAARRHPEARAKWGERPKAKPYCAVQPPSIEWVAPVMAEAASVQR